MLSTPVRRLSRGMKIPEHSSHQNERLQKRDKIGEKNVPSRRQLTLEVQRCMILRDGEG